MSLRNELKARQAEIAEAEKKLQAAREALAKAREHKSSLESELTAERDVELDEARSIAGAFLEGLKPVFGARKPRPRDVTRDLAQLHRAIVVLEERVAESEREVTQAQAAAGAAVAAVLKERLQTDIAAANEAKENLFRLVMNIRVSNRWGVNSPELTNLLNWSYRPIFHEHDEIMRLADATLREWKERLQIDASAELDEKAGARLMEAEAALPSVRMKPAAA